MTGKESETLSQAARVIVYGGIFYFCVYAFYLI